jgi:hypothetical protein
MWPRADKSKTMHAPTLPASQFREVARIACLLSVAALTATTVANSATGGAHNVPPEGFRALFNGHDLTGWWGASTEDPRAWMAMPPGEFQAKRAASLADIREHWRVEDGELVNDGDGLYLTTDAHFRDYELLIDYKTVAGADSGIYLKGCPQVQIWDSTEAGGKWDRGADKGSGGLWNNSPGTPGKDPLVHADKPFGEWNRFRIVQCGSRTWVWLNGERVVDGAIMENYFDETRSLPIPVAGPIQLQTHGGEIRWRNIFVRDLTPAEANLWLAAIAPAWFEPVFNGSDFSGWAGALDSYEIVDDAIACRADKGGTIHTEREFGNFAARLEFKLPPGGNNGLAIRYPGEGDPAYAGMCEIQVLDDTAPKYAALDPRQYHGSAYGMVAAHRGYLREVGEWNFQEVTVAGSTITVELNGNVVLRADLSAVSSFLDDKAHPGKDRVSGTFGFAGHQSPVMFRNISIKLLP